MATFWFSNSKIAEVRKAMALYGDKACVYFQPTHHGGCLQVCSENPGERNFRDIKNFEHTEVFSNRRTGYETFCHGTMLLDDVLLFEPKWIDFITTHKNIRITVKLRKPSAPGKRPGLEFLLRGSASP